MSPSEHLSKPQFGTTQEQSKPVSDWLATEVGHAWQDQEFYPKRVQQQRHLNALGADNEGFYSIKGDFEEPGPARILPDDYGNDRAAVQNHIVRGQYDFMHVENNRRRSEAWANAPLQWTDNSPERDFG